MQIHHYLTKNSNKKWKIAEVIFTSCLLDTLNSILELYRTCKWQYVWAYYLTFSDLILLGTSIWSLSLNLKWDCWWRCCMISKCSFLRMGCMRTSQSLPQICSVSWFAMLYTSTHFVKFCGRSWYERKVLENEIGLALLWLLMTEPRIRQYERVAEAESRVRPRRQG